MSPVSISRVPVKAISVSPGGTRQSTEPFDESQSMTARKASSVGRRLRIGTTCSLRDLLLEFEGKTGTVYVWAVEAKPEPQYITVLKTPPVTDPLTAVRAWLVSQASK
jgi:hypothetical protein